MGSVRWPFHDRSNGRCHPRFCAQKSCNSLLSSPQEPLKPQCVCWACIAPTQKAQRWSRHPFRRLEAPPQGFRVGDTVSSGILQG